MPTTEATAKCREYSCQGVTALECGDSQQAERLLRRAVESSPNDADARRHLAEALWASGDRQHAIEHLSAAVSQEPHHAPTLCRLGQMEAASGAWTQAIGRAQQALHQDPRLAAAWALRGRGRLETGDPVGGRGDLLRALEYAPNDRTVLTDLATLYAQQGRAERWLATVHRLQETYPHGESPSATYIMEADAYASLGRLNDAAERLQEAAARGPVDATFLHRLAVAEEACGRSTAAIAAAQRALSVDQSHLPSQQLLAKLNSPGQRLR